MAVNEQMRQLIVDWHLYIQERAITRGDLLPADKQAVKSSALIVLLAYRASSQETLFLTKLAQAISAHIASCEILSIESSDALLSFLGGDTTLVLAFKTALQQIPSFADKRCHTLIVEGNRHILLLEPPLLYDERAETKRELWIQLKHWGIQHALPLRRPIQSPPSSSISSTNP